MNEFMGLPPPVTGIIVKHTFSSGHRAPVSNSHVSRYLLKALGCVVDCGRCEPDQINFESMDDNERQDTFRELATLLRARASAGSSIRCVKKFD